MATTLTYRPFRDTDLPGVLRLWEEESGWGPLTADQWHQWYTAGPHGPSIIVVAEDGTGGIAAQTVFMPSIARVGTEAVPALRLSAPIVRRSVGQGSVRSMQHPFNQLLLAGLAEANARGYQLVYALPDPRWLPYFTWSARFDELRFAVATYPGMVDAVTLDHHDVPGHPPLIAKPVTAFSTPHEALWHAACTTFPIRCGVVRSSEWLQYKHGNHLAIEMHDPADASLVGYAVVKRETGLLVDLLAREPAAVASVIAAALRWLASEQPGPAGSPLTELKVMATPTLQPALHTLGFVPLAYTFAFVCRAMGGSLSPAAIAPEHWYLMPTD